MKTFAILALALLAAPALAQEPAPDPFPIMPSAWCVIQGSEPQAASPEATDGEAPVPATDPSPDVGCDLGVGMALQRWGKLSWVVVLGQETLGTGLAWVPYRPERGPIPAIALGVVVPYDSGGIYGSEAQLALGATLSFARGAREP